VAEGFLPESEPDEEEEPELPAQAGGFATSLAYELSRFTPEGLEEAGAFLRDQRKMILVQMEHLHEQRALLISRLKARRIGDWLKVCFQLFTALAATCIGGILVLMLFDAFNSKTVIVEPFDSPASLTTGGLTGKVVASDVLDGLTRLQAATRAAASKRHLANAWSGDIKVEVPETGVSIGEIDRLLHERFGHDEHIQGDLRLVDGGSLALTVRGDGVLPKTFTAPANELDKLTTQAAEYVYGQSEPFLFATYLIGTGRNDDALTFIQGAYAHATDADRPELANSWGTAELGLSHFSNAADKYRLAISLKPRMWKAWGNLVAALALADREEDAWRAGVDMQTQAAKSPRNDRPNKKFLVNFQQITQDWSSALADTLEDAKLNAGAGAGRNIQGPALAENYGRLHDWRNAQLYLTASDPTDPTTKAQGLLLPAYRALENGNPQAAIAPMEVFYAAWLADPDLQTTYFDQACLLGLAYALTGREAQAEPIYQRVGQRAACFADRADGLEASGNHQAANAAYATALHRFWDLPTVWDHWGVTLLRRGEIRLAEASFAAAHERGPHWADPLKSWGDALAAERRWPEALAKYSAAEEYAPNWYALQVAMAEARRHAGS